MSCYCHKAFGASTPTSSPGLEANSGLLVPTYLWTRGQHHRSSFGEAEETQQEKSRSQVLCADRAACQSRWFTRLVSDSEAVYSTLDLYPEGSLLEQCNLTLPEPAFGTGDLTLG